MKNIKFYLDSKEISFEELSKLPQMTTDRENHVTTDITLHYIDKDAIYLYTKRKPFADAAIREEKRNSLFNGIEMIKNYWLNLGKNTEDTLNGFIHSLLVMFDGDSNANDFHHLIIKDDEAALNTDDYLHELWVGYCEEENIDFNNI